MAGVVDADRHIAESEAMWRYIDAEMYPRRPVLARIPDDTWYKERNAFWLIDGEIFPKPAGKASFSLITPSAQKREAGRGDIHLAVRELTDPAARLKDMDKIGVDVQVIYPTLFLVYLTDDGRLETALCRAYNRFVAGACSRSPERLRWVAIAPLRDRDAALAEIEGAKDSGAEEACKAYEKEGVRIFIGDQADRGFWRLFKSRVPSVDVLIDDGGHRAQQQVATLEEMLPHLRPGGMYICEDVHGIENQFLSYVAGLSRNLNDWNVQAGELLAAKPTDFQKAIYSVHLYPYVIVIEKHEVPPESFAAPRHGTLWQPFLSPRSRSASTRSE